MALNFPDSPTLNEIYTDPTSGFSYEWNGTVWISYVAAGTVNIEDGSVTPLKLSTGGPSWNTDGDVYIAGITTVTNGSGTVTIGIGTTALLVEGNARVTGILTVGSSSITLDGTSNAITVGTGLTLSSDGIIAGIITATSFVGDGSGLTGAGSTVADDTTTNATFYPLFTTITDGTVTATKVSTSKLTFNPSTGTVVATTFSGALSGNSSTATTLQTARTINGISFNGSANIITNPTSGAYSNGNGTRTVSTGSPTGGSDGDIWYKY